MHEQCDDGLLVTEQKRVLQYFKFNSQSSSEGEGKLFGHKEERRVKDDNQKCNRPEPKRRVCQKVKHEKGALGSAK